MLVSIVVPIYNVAPFLRQCIESIDLLGHDEIEVILVNDGSTDDSRAICVEYEKRYQNVMLIDKDNGGLSDARNVGTNFARGDYIYYLDSDDWLVPGAIGRLYEFAVANDCEIVQGGFYYAYPDYLEYDNRWIEENDDPFCLSRENALCELIKNQYVKNFAWGKLYKSSVVKTHLFPVGKFYEDSYWQHLIINQTVRYGVIPAPLYYYRQRKDSISGTVTNRRLDLFEGMETQLLFVKEHYPELTGIIADRIWAEAFSSQNINKNFKTFFDNVNQRYSSLLSQKFRNSCFYKLANNASKLFPIYIFYTKVKGRITGKRLKRLEL